MNNIQSVANSVPGTGTAATKPTVAKEDSVKEQSPAVKTPVAQQVAVVGTVKSKNDPSAISIQLKEIIDSFNKELKASNRSLGFMFDSKLGMHIITIKNTISGEVMRQIPSEAVMRVANNIEELKGLFFDGKV